MVLFDEIEKAHPDVMNILLQILDDGRITDAHGKTVSFENTVIVMTTNAGSGGGMALAGFAGEGSSREKDKTEKALADFLRPEFLNRVDEIITFNSLTKENFVGIARIMLDDLKKALWEKHINFSYTDNAADIVAEKSYSVKFGARNMRRYIQTEIEDSAAELIVKQRGRISAISVDGENGELKVSAI